MIWLSLVEDNAELNFIEVLFSQSMKYSFLWLRSTKLYKRMGNCETNQPEVELISNGRMAPSNDLEETLSFSRDLRRFVSFLSWCMRNRQGVLRISKSGKTCANIPKFSIVETIVWKKVPKTSQCAKKETRAAWRYLR